MQKKLKSLKIALRSWNKEVFRNIHQAKENAEFHIEQAQEMFDANPSTENRMNLHKANAEMQLALHREEIFWFQKSRLQWITYGD